jgi:hypothetical protein
MMRGAAYQKVYRAIKEHDEVITSGKQAQKVKVSSAVRWYQ